MGTAKLLGFCALCLLGMSMSATETELAAPAASLNISPDPLTVGEKATITYSNPDRAGQTIIVDIDDGGVPTPKTSFVEITLDAAGDGSAKWTVPNWEGANFQAPGVGTQTVVILPAGGGQG